VKINAENFSTESDIVAEYFYMLSKMLRMCPKKFLNSQDHAVIIADAGLVGLQLRSREAQKCILLFFERLCESPFNPGMDSASVTLALELVNKISPKLVHLIFAQLSGQIQSNAYAIDEKDGCICDVLWCLKKSFTRTFNVIFTNIYNYTLIVMI
jgi:hypothetical protein